MHFKTKRHIFEHYEDISIQKYLEHFQKLVTNQLIFQTLKLVTSMNET